MLEYFKDITEFNPELFHFLRPRLLWLFVPMLLTLIILLFNTRRKNKWKEVIAPALRPFMFTKPKRSAITFPIIMYVLLNSFGIIALAGPTWKKINVDGKRNEAQLLIAVDASLSMLAEDVQPHRLERAKFKIKDLLDANPRALVSLYAYSALPYLVVPACSDCKLIKLHLDAISPATMPTQGTNLELMIQQADSALKDVVAPSTLLIITDVLEQKDIKPIEYFVNNSPHRVEILAMATPMGAQIPKNAQKTPVRDASGAVVISKLNPDVLFTLQKNPKVNVNSLTLDNSDMELLAKSIRDNLYFQDDAKESDEDWRDMGYLLLVLIVIIMPFWFRRGWVIQYCLLGFFLIGCSNNQTWDDLWETKDYQAQKLYDDGSFDDAGSTYKSAMHKGTAYYKAGNYDAAAQAFEQDSSANSLYNLSLCYSQLGDYNKALSAIELASGKDPSNEAFKFALNETRNEKLKMDSLSASSNSIVLKEKPDSKKDPLQERKAQSEDEKLSSDTKVDKLPEDGDRVTDEVATDKRKAKELEEVPDDFQSGPKHMPSDILLQGISEDPQEFLRRRFKYQYKKYYSDKKQPQEIW
ncbi:MAG: vWA domain-containing protein [Mangrovibacterium sp.]